MFKIRKVVTYIMVIIVLVALVSCQKTPEKVVVKKKDDELMNTIIKSNESTDELDNINEKEPFINVEWQEHIKPNNNGFEVEININNSIPNVRNCPVYKVDTDEFTVDKIQSIKQTLFGDKQLYKIDLNNPRGRLTKSEIEELILQIQKSINDPNSDFNNANLSKDEYELRLKEKQDSIKYYKNKYKSASNEVVRTEANIDYDAITNGLMGYVKEEDKKCSSFFVSASKANDKVFNSLSCSFPRRSRNMYKFNNFTLEDAKATSEEFIKKLGISNMSCEYYSIKSQHDNFIDYKLVYTKKYDSLSQTYTTQEIQHDSADIYTAPWKYEELIISVDNTGVYDFLWNSPTKVTKTLSDSVKLLSFNKTMDIFKNQIQFKVVWDNKEDAIIDRKLFIDEIRLGMMRVNIKDSIDEYMVIPVYDFFGEEVLTYSDKQPGGYILDENNQCVSRKERFSYITINAIDGSIINRELGY